MDGNWINTGAADKVVVLDPLATPLTAVVSESGDAFTVTTAERPTEAGSVAAVVFDKASAQMSVAVLGDGGASSTVFAEASAVTFNGQIRDAHAQS